MAPPQKQFVNEVEEEVTETGAVWWIGQIDVELPKMKVERKNRCIHVKNRYQALGEEEKEEDKTVEISMIDMVGKKLSRQSAMKFNEADVRKPLASAVQVAKAGNKIVLDEDGGYIQNKKSGERIEVKVDKNTYIFELQGGKRRAARDYSRLWSWLQRVATRRLGRWFEAHAKTARHADASGEWHRDRVLWSESRQVPRS